MANSPNDIIYFSHRSVVCHKYEISFCKRALVARPGRDNNLLLFAQAQAHAAEGAERSALAARARRDGSQRAVSPVAAQPLIIAPASCARRDSIGARAPARHHARAGRGQHRNYHRHDRQHERARRVGPHPPGPRARACARDDRWARFGRPRGRDRKLVASDGARGDDFRPRRAPVRNRRRAGNRRGGQSFRRLEARRTDRQGRARRRHSRNRRWRRPVRYIRHDSERRAPVCSRRPNERQRRHRCNEHALDSGGCAARAFRVNRKLRRDQSRSER